MNPEFPMRNTTLCYLEQDGKWLMLHRVTKKNDMNHDKWIGVGGSAPIPAPLRCGRGPGSVHRSSRLRCKGACTRSDGPE